MLGNCFIKDIVTYSTANISLSPNHLQFTHDFIFTAEKDGGLINVWKYEKGASSPRLINQLQSIEQLDNIQITILKLVDDDNNNDTKHLIAGYSNGGFTLWQVLTTDITEVANYISTSTTQLEKVIAIGMELPMVLLYTENGKLSVFRINTSTNSLNLVHQLQSPMNWSPVKIDIHKCPTNKRNLWKAVICFGLSGGSYTTTVGIQAS